MCQLSKYRVSLSEQKAGLLTDQGDEDNTSLCSKDQAHTEAPHCVGRSQNGKKLEVGPGPPDYSCPGPHKY